MSASAIVNDGQITNLGTTTEAEKKKTGNDSVDKEQFLNLLVTELKYQDPLQPMDNTEYVAQLATFSELEQMQNVAKTTEVSRATAMVGSLVTVESTNPTTGVTTTITGKVDFVSVNGSKVKVSVNDQLYDLSDVKEVFDTDYADAVALAEEFAAAYGKLPGFNNLTSANASSYEGMMRALYKTYDGMSTYQKTFLSAEIQAGMESYVARFKEYGIDVTTDKVSTTGNSSNNNSGSNSGSTSTETPAADTNTPSSTADNNQTTSTPAADTENSSNTEATENAAAESGAAASGTATETTNEVDESVIEQLVAPVVNTDTDS